MKGRTEFNGKGENKGSRRRRVRSPTRPAVLDTKRKAKKQTGFVNEPAARTVQPEGQSKGGQRRD